MAWNAFRVALKSLRRFGRSLLIDTLRELFSGNEPLFRGLAIHDQWDWSETHPVVRLMDLLDRLCHKTGKQVVVLVDEYDKPILDVLDDPEQAEASGSGHYLSTFRTSGTTPAVSTSSRPTMRACCTCVFALSAPTFR